MRPKSVTAEMGFIYLITNTVSGKHYVGQTRRTIQVRYYEHLYRAATEPEIHPFGLKSALVEFGPENFKVEQLYECNDDDLNFHEERLIKEYNSLHPNGYNLVLGPFQSEESVAAMREVVTHPKWRKMLSERFKKYDKDLPMYMQTRTVKSEIRGYRVDHPNGRKTFADPEESMESKYQRALEFLDKCNNTGEKINFTNTSGIKYIKKSSSGRGGWRVIYPGFPMRAFERYTISSDENLANAVAYLNECKRKEEVQRLKDDGLASEIIKIKPRKSKI